LGRPSEDELIETFFAPLAGPGGLGLRDDAAVLSPPGGHDLVLTTDVLVSGVHFFADDPAALVARKALRVNLSDLAAKGATPAGFLLALVLPEFWTTDWLAAFADGLRQDSVVYACPLLGGDTSRTPGPLMISITAFGSVPTGGMVPRGGVAVGDLIYVSGTIGDAALGLALRKRSAAEPSWTETMSAAAKSFLEDRYLLPQPRLVLGAALRRYARAAMDVSDGLAGDLAKMLRLSGTTAEISIADVPLSDAAREAVAREPGLVETMLCGGDDYEILCAVPPAWGGAFEDAARVAGVPVRAIGTAVPGAQPPTFKDAQGQSLAITQASFQHF
jgi:thiamine-monophosphate kinase